MKSIVCFLSLFLFAGIAQSQSLLLEKDQNSFTVEGSMAGGHNFTSLGLAVGATEQGTLDVGIAVSRVFHEFDNYWVLGQFASVKILSETSADYISGSLSLRQGFSFSQGIELLSLGGAFALKSKLNRESTVLFSLGYNRNISLSPDNQKFNSVTISLTLALGDSNSLFQLTPFATLVENNRSVYGIAFGNSSIVTSREQEEFTF